MNYNEKESKIRNALLLMFKNFKEYDVELLDYYFQRLKEFDCYTVCKRIFYLMDNSKFRPPIGDILQFFQKKELNYEQESELKWDIFRKQAFTRYPENMQPWIKEIQSKMGRVKCEDSQSEDLPWLKKEFINYYCLFRQENILQLNAENQLLLVGGK